MLKTLESISTERINCNKLNRGPHITEYNIKINIFLKNSINSIREN